MATLTVWAAADGYIQSSDSASSYSNARAGTGSDGLFADPTGGQLATGQFGSGGGTSYTVYESFVDWTTSALGASVTVSAALIDLWLDNDRSDADFTLQARLRDWGGGTVTTGDWVAGASLAALTSLATLATSGIGAANAYKTMTDVALPANVNKTGSTRIILVSSKTQAGTAPGGSSDEWMTFLAAETGGASTTNDPKLTITYTVPATGTGAVSLPVPELAATGTMTIQGTAAVTVEVPVVGATGAATQIDGPIAVTVEVPVLAATGAVTTVYGAVSVTVEVPVLGATGSTLGGTIAVVVEVPVLAAAGAVLTPNPVAAMIYGRGDLTGRAYPAGAGQGIEVEVYDPTFSPPRLMAVLEGARVPAWQDVLNDVGSFGFRVPLVDAEHGPRVIARGNLVKFRLHGAHRFAGWIEQLSPTRVSIEGQSGEWMTVAGTGALSYLGRARLPFREISPEEEDDLENQGIDVHSGNWTSVASFIAVLLKEYIEDAQAADRLVLPLLDVDWTSSVDSAGLPWNDAAAFQFTWGSTSLLDVLKAAVGMGVDFRIDPDLVLTAYEEGTGVDRSSTVVFRAGWHLRSEVVGQQDEQAFANVMMVRGATKAGSVVGEPVHLTVYGDHSDPRRGRREGVVDFTSTGATGALQRAGYAALTAASGEARSLKLPLFHGLKDGHFEPYLDYTLGDTIGLRSPGFDETARVHGVSVTGTDYGGYLVDVDVGAFRSDNMVRLTRLIEGNRQTLLRNLARTEALESRIISLEGGLEPD